ncbi:MAG: D-aminoacyl-tRNA deacylase [Planctomycetota bacterium]|nr:D-aminoacyl-tRNA deacylase [Planctomycetota bacterium]
MRVVVQRVQRAAVVVEGVVVASIDRGLLALVGVEQRDAASDVEWMAQKLAGLRVFADASGKMNLAMKDVGGWCLLVPNFTLAARPGKGNRPSFDNAKNPSEAKSFFDTLVSRIFASGVPVATGVFGADMRVELANDGPVTLILESPGLESPMEKPPAPGGSRGVTP